MNALVLFDIDGTLLRNSGGWHRRALEGAALKVLGVEATLDGIPTSGMLDRDLIRIMLSNAGVSQREIGRAMQPMIDEAQTIYLSTCPSLRKRVTPGSRMLLWRLHRRRVPTGLVTGNLTRIGWHKMESAGLRGYLRFGAFAELASTRAGLVKLAVAQARREGWIDRKAPISLIGDHPNDIQAAKANGVQSIGVGTGVIGMDALRRERPDILVEDLRSLKMEQLF
ncbi:MAG: HAD family hydrolase [Bryobacteraceae bacterium]